MIPRQKMEWHDEMEAKARAKRLAFLAVAVYSEETVESSKPRGDERLLYIVRIIIQEVYFKARQAIYVGTLNYYPAQGSLEF